MLHTKRRWHVVQVTREQLVDRLARHHWDLCAGFFCEGILWLNDSVSADSPQMYAALRYEVDTGDWQQLEVFSVSWMARDRLRSLLADLSAFGGWSVPPPQVQWESSDWRCELCA